MSIPESKVWVVIPVFNEEKYLARFLGKLKKFTSNVIIVDDGSSDNTRQIARESANYSLRHKINIGKGAALKTGCDFAFDQLEAEAVIIMDGDDQHDPAEIPDFLSALNKGAQVVFGIREEPKDMPWIKLKLNRLSSFITYLLFGRYILDIPSGYKAFTKAAYAQLAWEANDYGVELEIAARTAKYNLAYTTVCIKTIYHDMNKGFTAALHIFSIIKHLVRLKLTL